MLYQNPRDNIKHDDVCKEPNRITRVARLIRKQKIIQSVNKHRDDEREYLVPSQAARITIKKRSFCPAYVKAHENAERRVSWYGEDGAPQSDTRAELAYVKHVLQRGKTERG